MEVLASKGADGYTAIQPKQTERLVDILRLVWPEHNPERAFSLRQTPESMGKSEVQEA
jgi:hypothetical protein